MLSCKNKLTFMTGGLVLGAVMIVFAPAANALTVPLQVYNDNGTPTDFSAEIDVSCNGGGCDLTFTNTSDPTGVAQDSAIHQIYLEEGFGDYFSSSTISGTTGDVSFVKGNVTPGTKPQANTLIDGGWTSTWSDGYFVRDGNKDDGINPLLSSGDSLTISLAFLGNPLTSLALVSNILSDLENMMVAVHVNACGPNDASCAANAVPIPGAIWLLGSALLGLFGFSARGRMARG